MGNTRPRIHFFIHVSFILFAVMLNAQQDSQYTQYMYNTQSINPAYVGRDGEPSIIGLYRNQWVGLQGAPETYLLSAGMPLSDKVGLGVNFFNDVIGASVENNLNFDVSYSVFVSDNTKLAVGVKAGFNILNVDFTRLDIADASDPGFINVNNQISPVIGSGGYLYTEDWYLGLSVPNLITTDFYDDVAQSTAEQEMQFNLIGGYVFDLSRTLLFKPTFWIRATSGSPLAYDFSANMLYNDILTFGVAYRVDAAVSALAGFQVSESVMIGYAYDYDTTALGNYSSGSHEVFLRFQLKDCNCRLIRPRFF